MRTSLKWRMAGAHALVSVILIGALAAHVRERVDESMVRELRDRLLGDCHVVWAAIDGVPAEQVPTFVAELAPLMDARITVVRPDGFVMADSEADPGGMVPHNMRPEILDARAQQHGWARRHSSTLGVEMLYVAYSPGPDAPTVRAAMALSTVHATTDAVRRAILVAAVLTAAVAIGLGAWIAGRVTRTLHEVSAVAQRVGQGDLAARAPTRDSDEVGDLARALNTMTSNLAETRASLERTATDLASILTQMADGVLVIGADESIRVLNPAAGELLRADPEASHGRSLSEVALHYELVDLARRAMRLDSMLVGELSNVGDEPTTVAAAATPLHDASGALDGAVLTLRDITGLKLLQRQRTEFVTNASHELRTPVASIRALAEALGSGAVDDPEVGGRFLSRIVENTESLTKLLDDLSTLGRLDEGGPWLDPESVPVAEILSAAASRLETAANDRGVSIEARPVEDTLTVWCCRDALLAAIANLIENGVKYTPVGGRVLLHASPEADNKVRISVSDTGPGIAPEHRERVFERFYRIDKGRSRELGGTGLGLSIVKNAIESNGGYVFVGDGPEGGAEFVVMLPAPAPKT